MADRSINRFVAGATGRLPRRWGYWTIAPLIMMGTFGMVGSGVVAAEPGTDTNSITLRISNATDRAMWVNASKTKGRSMVATFSGMLARNEQGYGKIIDKVDHSDEGEDIFTEVELCYDHRVYSDSWRTADPKWNDLYVFVDSRFFEFDKPFVTGSGAYDNHPLQERAGRC